MPRRKYILLPERLTWVIPGTGDRPNVEVPGVTLEQVRTMSEAIAQRDRAIEAATRKAADAKSRLDQRNRKSSPSSIRRNVEICDLRRQNPTLWSLGRLSKKYGISVRRISRILKDEDRWRSLAKSL